MGTENKKEIENVMRLIQISNSQVNIVNCNKNNKINYIISAFTYQVYKYKIQLSDNRLRTRAVWAIKI